MFNIFYVGGMGFFGYTFSVFSQGLEWVCWRFDMFFWLNVWGFDFNEKIDTNWHCRFSSDWERNEQSSSGQDNKKLPYKDKKWNKAHFNKEKNPQITHPKPFVSQINQCFY